MRPLVTWLLVGALLVIGLFAARDALQSEGTAAEPPAAADTAASDTMRSPAGPPPIPGRGELVTELEKLGARGALSITDASCRRFILSLPTLTWTTSRELPGSDCGLWMRQPSDADSGIVARQVNADTVEVTSGGWSYGFEGISPAFKPDGILTFVRDGRLREWTGRCPETAEKVVFEGLHDVARCDRPVEGAPRDVREVAWLSVSDYAVVAGPDGATSLEVVRGGRTERLFNSVGARMGALEASPSGRYVVVRLDGALTLFRTDASRALRPLPANDELVRSITWSRDERLAAFATETSVAIFPSDAGARAVRIPLSVAAVQWR
jgi:WD40 repeat protein